MDIVFMCTWMWWCLCRGVTECVGNSNSLFSEARTINVNNYVYFKFGFMFLLVLIFDPYPPSKKTQQVLFWHFIKLSYFLHQQAWKSHGCHIKTKKLKTWHSHYLKNELNLCRNELNQPRSKQIDWIWLRLLNLTPYRTLWSAMLSSMH